MLYGFELQSDTFPTPLNIRFDFRHGVAETKHSEFVLYKRMMRFISALLREQHFTNVYVDSNLVTITSYSETDC